MPVRSILVATLAFPLIALGGDTSQQLKEAGRSAGQDVKETARSAGQDVQEAGQNAKQAVSDTTDGKQQTGTPSASPIRQMRKANEGPFSFNNNYDVEGTIKSVSGGTITIGRDDLPPAKLHVRQATKVQLDGETVSLKQLRQGQGVKARFNLDGDKPLAIEINADSKASRAARTGGGHTSGTATPGGSSTASGTGGQQR